MSMEHISEAFAGWEMILESITDNMDDDSFNEIRYTVSDLHEWFHDQRNQRS